MAGPSKAAPKRSAGAPKRSPSAAPLSKRAASSGSQPSGDGTRRTDGGRIGLDRRAAWFSAALILFVVFTSLELFSQHPRNDAFETLQPRDPRWWFTSLELNATRRLPRVEGDLNAIGVAPETRQVWMVGEGGLVLHSPDGGETWERQALAPSGKGSAAAPAAARLAPGAGAAQDRTLATNPLDAVATFAFLAAPPEGSPLGKRGSENGPIQQQAPQAQAPPTGTVASGSPAGPLSPEQQGGAQQGLEQQTAPPKAAPATAGGAAGASAASTKPKAGAKAAPSPPVKTPKAGPRTGKTAKPAAPAGPSRAPVSAAQPAAGPVGVTGALDLGAEDVENTAKANLYAGRRRHLGWIRGQQPRQCCLRSCPSGSGLPEVHLLRQAARCLSAARQDAHLPRDLGRVRRCHLEGSQGVRGRSGQSPRTHRRALARQRPQGLDRLP